MDIIKLKGVSYASNTYVIISGSDAAVIDPSVEIKEVKGTIGNAKLRYILLTHGHFDHILKLDSLRCETKAEVLIHSADENMLTDPEINASAFFGLDFSTLGADRALSDGEEILLGREKITVIHTPGHTPGSVCFDCGDAIICGDTVFKSGYGRYDLPGGDPHVLLNSLTRLADRRDNPMIHPGHGESCYLAQATIIQSLRN